jgi:hypothetical protein
VDPTSNAMSGQGHRRPVLVPVLGLLMVLLSVAGGVSLSLPWGWGAKGQPDTVLEAAATGAAGDSCEAALLVDEAKGKGQISTSAAEEKTFVRTVFQAQRVGSSQIQGKPGRKSYVFWGAVFTTSPLTPPCAPSSDAQGLCRLLHVRGLAGAHPARQQF